MTQSPNRPEQRVLDLINAELDGELGAAERRELEELLEASGEARAERAEMQGLFDVLGSVPLEEPPASILSGFDGEAARPRRSKSALAGIFYRFQWATVGLGLAAGLLLTVAVYEFNDPISGLDSHQAVGTVGVVNRRALDAVTVAGPDIAGKIVLSETSGELLLTVDLDTGGEAAVVVDIGRSGLAFEGLRLGQGRAAVESGTVEYSDGRLTVRNHGRQAYSVVLSQPDKRVEARLTLEVSAGDTTVYAGALRG